MKKQSWSLKGRGLATLIAAVIVAVLGLRTSNAFADEPIVGYWQVTFKEGTSGDVIVNVWEAWHNDRTEMQNVSANPIGGNVCQGAWVPLEKRSYGLNHPFFAFNTEPEDKEGQLNTDYS